MKRFIAIFTIFIATSVGSLAAEGINFTVGATGALGLFDAAGKETLRGTHIIDRNNSDGDSNTFNDTKTTSKRLSRGRYGQLDSKKQHSPHLYYYRSRVHYSVDKSY